MQHSSESNNAGPSGLPSQASLPAADSLATDATSHQVSDASRPSEPSVVLPLEVGGRDGPEPTRFGDWEKSGRCIDF